MDWSRILTVVFLIQILAAAVRLATPLVLAALGEVFAERSGVLNLGIEGIMLLGGFAGFSAALATENLWVGVLAGLLVGALMGLFFAMMTVSLRSDQIVTGLAFLILSTGAAIYFYRLQFSISLLAPSIRPFRSLAIPLLSDIPILGPVLFNHDVLTYIMLLLVPAAAIVLFHTPFGLRVTAAGEYPQAADTVGVNVTFTRYICVIIGGILAGLAGAYFSLAELGFFANTMVGGRGFIALALVVFGRWNPMWILAGGLLFGGVDAVQTRFQFLGSNIPSNFLIMMPYLLTIVVLLFGRRQNAPAALTIPYTRE
jgi:simple sugar transport system permease protein